MGGASDAANRERDERFAWHPHYHEKTAAEVAAEIRADLEHDQRAYELALSSAEERENDTLAAILDLDKKWGQFDMGWAECNAAELAGRVVAFEQERDRRQELFPYADYRAQAAASTPAPAADRPWWAFWRQ